MFGSKRKKQMEQMADMIANQEANQLLDLMQYHSKWNSDRYLMYLLVLPVYLDDEGWRIARQYDGQFEKELRSQVDTKLRNIIGGFLMTKGGMERKAIEDLS